jgi:uncharacterized protein (TIGR03437 family)
MDKVVCKFRWAVGFCLLCAVTAIASHAQTFTTLVNFKETDGAHPYYGAPLIQGRDGNLYGTTWLGGNPGLGLNDVGTVFEMTPGGALTTLHSFSGTDGADLRAGLVQATDGNLYGTTYYGGVFGYSGTVFKITPAGTVTTLHRFDSTDGIYPSPVGTLIQTTDGNFYCATDQGGTNGKGSIFRMTPAGTVTTLYSFAGIDGAIPQAGLIQAADGNIYGTTSRGGSNGQGTVFKITTGGALTTLHSFGDSEGIFPWAGLFQATDGNFYGTTTAGGTNGHGTIFKVTPAGVMTTLYSFADSDGATPNARPIQASDGNFYGTTTAGGSSGLGTIYKITPGGTLTTMHSFASTDGKNPYADLLQAADGNLYGATNGGGTYGFGTVFSLPLTASTPVLPAITFGTGIVSGASFEPGIAPNSWITILGTNLSTITDTWANSIVGGNLPTSLDGVSVSVGGQPAYISYISPTQINALTPNFGTETVKVTVTNSIGTSSPIFYGPFTMRPAFFQWGSYAVATRLDYTLAVKNGSISGQTTMPAKPGDTIILWGTGFGPTNPIAPLGVEVPTDATYNTTNKVTVTVGGVSAIVYGAALTPGYAGLYQVAIQIPPSLTSGDYSVVAAISGFKSPSAALITVQE